MPRPGLTAIITTLNEEINIRDCLASVAFADRILVVDSFSTDRTVEIAREFPNVQIFQREYFGSAAQKNWAMDKVETPWLLIVDADERVPERLAREIQAVIEKDPPEDHFYVRRENVFIDRVIRHSGWSTDKVIRLIRRGTARYPNRRVPFQFALAFAGLGDKDQTMEQLALMAGAGPVRLGRDLTFPEFALVRGDARVKALRKKIGLPE